MSRIRYKPRFKKGVIKNQKIIPVIKKGAFFRRLKWRSYTFGVSKSFLFLRNDTLAIHTQVLDQRKQYTLGNTNRQIFFAYFSILKNKDLKTYLFKKRKTRNLFTEFFFNLLEHRLDHMLVKAALAKTTFQARWLISRGFVWVNKKRVLSSSHILQKGDFVQLVLAKETPLFKDRLFFNMAAISFSQNTIEVNYATFSFIVLNRPMSLNFSAGLYPHFFNFEELVNYRSK